MRFKYVGVSFIFFLLFIGCNKEEPESIPNCIEQKIKTLKKEAVWNPPAKIYSYTYQNRTVYFFPQRCCDFPSELYDEDCTLLCLPDGGITGQGDGTCADFFSERSNEKLVWKDSRE